MRKHIITLALLMALALATNATSEVPQRFNYQGFLADSAGNPVADGDYTLYFSIFSDTAGGFPLWAETVTVRVESGIFDVVIGSHNPLSTDLFAPSEPGDTSTSRYLEVQLEGEPDPLSPRSVISSTPTALVSSRVRGDISTGPGSLMVVHGGLIDEPPYLPYFEVTTDSEGTSVSLADPRPTPVFPDITIKGNADGSQVTTAGASAQFPYFELYSGEGGAGLSLADPRPTPLFPGITIAGDATGSRITNGGVIDEFPFFELKSDLSSVSLSLADPRPTPVFAGITIAGDSTGSRITNGGVIDEYPFFELKSDLSSVSLSLADPRPTPAFPDVTLTGDENGTHMAINYGGLIDELPLFDLLAKTAGTRIMLPAPEVGTGPFDPWPPYPLPGAIMFMMADEQGPKIVFGDPATQNELITMRADTASGAIEMKNSTGETQWKVEDGEAVAYQPGTSAKTVTSYQGIQIYDSGGDIETSLLTDGVVAPKGNFGNDNTNTGASAFVAGTGNDASGYYATVPGGRGNSASGDYSLAAGRNAAADHEGSFVWADASGAAVTTTANNQFLCRAIGGTKFYTTANNSTGVQLNYGSSQWQTLSSRHAKRNIEPIDGQWILERMERLPISRWSYKAQDPDMRHIGPMAEDFNSLFGVGEDSTRISTLDPAGVALAGVKELAKQNRELRERITQLEALVEKLLAQQDESNEPKIELGMNK
jgi:hypothetical protein